MKRRKNPLAMVPLPLAIVGLGAGCLLAWEGLWWVRRKKERYRIYYEAEARARELGKPLVVVGAPDGGPTNSPCGDINVDISPSAACPHFIQADITKPLPFADNSVVCYVACVLSTARTSTLRIVS